MWTKCLWTCWILAILSLDKLYDLLQLWRILNIGVFIFSKKYVLIFLKHVMRRSNNRIKSNTFNILTVLCWSSIVIVKLVDTRKKSYRDSSICFCKLLKWIVLAWAQGNFYLEIQDFVTLAIDIYMRYLLYFSSRVNSRSLLCCDNIKFCNIKC